MRGTAMAAVLGAMLCTGCGETKKSESAPVPVQPPPLMCYIGIDGSASYDLLPQARRAIEKLIAALPAGSVVSAWWITSDSYQPENNILTSTAPAALAVAADNPFDPKAKQEKARGARVFGKWRRETVARIASAPSPRSGHTDVYGFLALAGERIHAYDGPAVVVIFSDLESNVERYRKSLGEDTLAGAPVVVAAFEKRDPAKRASSEMELKRYGAGDVVFIDGDEVGNTNFRELLGSGGQAQVAAVR